MRIYLIVIIVATTSTADIGTLRGSSLEESGDHDYDHMKSSKKPHYSPTKKPIKSSSLAPSRIQPE